jgi:hypothetical protein
MSTKSHKFMYGLPKAGIIANERLVKYLAEYGHTSSLFTHATPSIIFSLIINGFGVTYAATRIYTEHSIQTLKSLYNSTTEWGGELYYGLTLAWD